jgi:hypothetical protein
MSDVNLLLILTQQAKNDLRSVRRKNSLIICDTTLGNIEVTYQNRRYSVRQFNTGVDFLENVTNQEAMEFLIYNYQIEMNGTVVCLGETTYSVEAPDMNKIFYFRDVVSATHADECLHDAGYGTINRIS